MANSIAGGWIGDKGGVLRGRSWAAGKFGFVSSKKVCGGERGNRVLKAPERICVGFVALSVALFCAGVLRGWMRNVWECGREGVWARATRGEGIEKTLQSVS